MGDAGEGLVDVEARLQEQAEARQRDRTLGPRGLVDDPDRVRERGSLQLARTELERQLAATTHEARRAQLVQALEDIDRRLEQV